MLIKGHCGVSLYALHEWCWKRLLHAILRIIMVIFVGLEMLHASDYILYHSCAVEMLVGLECE